MENMIQAQLISVGTELLRGEITDTNATFLASQLPLLGIELNRMTTAGDNLKDLCQILRQAIECSNVVITTGGLGPTQDDLTREAVADLFNETMTVDPQLERNLRDMFSRFNREMPPHNIKQAMLIPSASPLPNPRGTAPGWWVEKHGKVIILLPGPPREMTFMWQNEVLPRIKLRFPAQSIQTRTIKTYFIQEAKVAELAQPFFQSDNPTLGIYAKPDGIQIRFLATGSSAEQILDEAEKNLVEKLSPYVWGKDDETLDGIIGTWLTKHRLKLATIEDFTGGSLAALITNSKLSPLYYRAGIIAADDHIKPEWGVTGALIKQFGAVSPEVASALATSVKQKSTTDLGISITGIDKEGRVYIGIADKSGTKTWQQQYQAGRADNRERATMAALFRLRERLIELKLTDE
jgi:nicotinamide-nucleotide amidase